MSRGMKKNLKEAKADMKNSDKLFKQGDIEQANSFAMSSIARSLLVIAEYLEASSPEEV